MSDSIAGSDKYYWHRYIETYRAAFGVLGPVRRAVEFGVFHGASIRWLAECFPLAEIIGADILVEQSDWPRDARISYRRIDQGKRSDVRTMLGAIAGEIDLIIDDGSHVPQHQASCLAEGLVRVRAGGLYILEDICTSHPLHPAFAHHSIQDGIRIPNALNVLLAIQHNKDTGRSLDTAPLSGLLSQPDIATLLATIDRVEIYRRTQLPLRCYACGGEAFDYVAWLCRCGAELYHPADSMTALVWKV